MRQIGSVTTGLLAQTKAPSRSTGEQHGETGVARRTSAAPAHPMPTAAPEAVTESLLTRLKSETGFNVRLMKDWRFPEMGGSYQILASIEVWTADTFDELAALAVWRAHMQPAPMRALVDMATLLKVGCKARAEGEDMTAAQIKVYADTLGRYPADVAREAVDRWLTTEKFFPAISELHDGSKRAMQGRDRIGDEIRREARRRSAPNDDQPRSPLAGKMVTPEFIEETRRKYRPAAP